MSGAQEVAHIMKPDVIEAGIKNAARIEALEAQLAARDAEIAARPIER